MMTASVAMSTSPRAPMLVRGNREMSNQAVGRMPPLASLTKILIASAPPRTFHLGLSWRHGMPLHRVAIGGRCSRFELRIEESARRPSRVTM